MYIEKTPEKERIFNFPSLSEPLLVYLVRVTGKGLVRRADNAAEAAQMMGHNDATVLTATLDAYTGAANGKRADDFGKTVFPSKNFVATEPLCEFGGGRPVYTGRSDRSDHHGVDIST